MANKQTTVARVLGERLLSASRWHFAYVGAYILSIIIFDSWNLLAHEAVVQRWTLAGVLLVVTTAVWFAARQNNTSLLVQRSMLSVLLAADIVFAALNVFYQRGMASKAVFLFVIPLLVAALARSRSLVLAVATLSTAVYSYVAVRYFHENYGQGFRVELYGEVAFYSLMFFVVAWLLIAGFRSRE